jgi:5-hydroxyisourate hydrolase-like protein (transthyretin family)
MSPEEETGRERRPGEEITAHDPDGSDDLDRPVRLDGGVISGLVTDFSKIPLAGVRVEAASSAGADLDMLPVLTDGDGRFAVEGLAPGRYDLRFSLGQVRSRVLAVPVGTDQLRVRLARPQGILLVMRHGPDEPRPGTYHILLERTTPEGLVREHCGRVLKSRLLLWSIRPGRYDVTVWGGPYLPVRVRGVDVREGEPAPEVEVALAARGAEVEGVLRAASGEARAGLIAWRRLDAESHAPRHVTTQSTDEDGRYALRGLPAGRYRLTACSGDLTQVGAADAHVPEAGQVRLDIVLA